MFLVTANDRVGDQGSKEEEDGEEETRLKIRFLKSAAASSLTKHVYCLNTAGTESSSYPTDLSVDVLPDELAAVWPSEHPVPVCEPVSEPTLELGAVRAHQKACPVPDPSPILSSKPRMMPMSRPKREDKESTSRKRGKSEKGPDLKKSSSPSTHHQTKKELPVLSVRVYGAS